MADAPSRERKKVVCSLIVAAGQEWMALGTPGREKDEKLFVAAK